jgi:hypothetical protein
VAWGADNEKNKFEVKPAASYPHHQTSEKVIIAAQAFETDEETRDAFGKINPNRYGILPILIVIQNDGPDAIKIDRIKFNYTMPDGKQIDATPAQDVKFIHGARAPNALPVDIRIHKKPKNPLAEWEIEGRAFAAKMVPAGQSASGFVYFQIDNPSAAAVVDISGMTDPVTGKELFYFEIPMSGTSH